MIGIVILDSAVQVSLRTAESRMKNREPEELAKLHCLNALFGAIAGDDAEITGHIKSAIDYSLTGEFDTPAPLRQFAEAALELYSQQERLVPSYGLEHLDLRGRNYEPLWIQQEVIALLKQLSGYARALLLVSGLRESLRPHGRYWTQRLRREHDEAVAYIDRLALKWSTPNCSLTLLYL